MSYYDEFSKRVADRVDGWKKVRQAMAGEVEKQKAKVEQYQAAIDADMDKGEATDETAKNGLNLQYAEKRLTQAEYKLKVHDAEPLYTLDEYDAECNEIVGEYKKEIQKKVDQLTKEVDKSLKLLDEIHGLRKDAQRCDNVIRSASKECGTADPAETFETSQFARSGPAGRVEPTYKTNGAERALKEARKSLEAKL